MLTIKHRWIAIRTIFLYLLLIILSWGLISCGDRLETDKADSEQSFLTEQPSQLSEVAPPLTIQKLRASLDKYQPQVSIISPPPDKVFTETTVEVELQIKDLPIFKDPQLALGPYIQLILDDQTYLPIYDLEKPLVLENLTPGTHTLRVFAVRPWHESFKNEGAYAQTNFHILTRTDNKAPDTSKPLLTYNRPQGSYGAEPIMLDFYLTNAPLHFVARQNTDDDIKDWRIRVTINGESFLLDNWKPVYLTGFKPGTNWVKLEFLDEQGNIVDNRFNTTVELITYQPDQQDTLSKLIKGELTQEMAQAIVDPSYQTQTKASAPEPETPPVEEQKTPEPTLEAPPVEEEPLVEEEKTPEPETPLVEEEPLIKEPEKLQPTLKTPPVEIIEPLVEEEKTSEPTLETPPVVEEPLVEEEKTPQPTLETPPVVEEPLVEEEKTPQPTLEPSLVEIIEPLVEEEKTPQATEKEDFPADLATDTKKSFQKPQWLKQALQRVSDVIKSAVQQ
jgi:hypothetical protein